MIAWLQVRLRTDVFLHPNTALELATHRALAGMSLLLVFFPLNLSGAFRYDADGGAVQPYEVSHLFRPTLVNVNSTVNPLVGQESRTG